MCKGVRNVARRIRADTRSIATKGVVRSCCNGGSIATHQVDVLCIVAIRVAILVSP